MSETIDDAADQGARETDALDGTPAGPGTSRWQAYRDAALGFRNHWYPAAFGEELLDDEPRGVCLLGEHILLTRVDGTVRAIRDRCPHRGVRFSDEPLCLAKGTITCWYHAFTFELDTGILCDVLTWPQSPAIGRVSVRTYHVQEAKGLVFVFIGDDDPPPLADDVPPGFLDPGTYALGMRRPVRANWRLGAENGADPTHIFIHRDSVLLAESGMTMPIGFVPTGIPDYRVTVDDWPKGVVHLPTEGGIFPLFEAKIHGETVMQREPKMPKPLATEGGIFLPGVLKIGPWPDLGMIQYEWYVPIDECSHTYFQVICAEVDGDDDVARFRDDFEQRWKPLALHGFNDDDIKPRESMQHFYEEEHGWSAERLHPPDAGLLVWRRVAAHARGIQTREHAAR